MIRVPLFWKILALCAAAASARAQDMVRATDADRVTITGVSPEESILPTARPLTSVYGTEQNIVDIRPAT